LAPSSFAGSSTSNQAEPAGINARGAVGGAQASRERPQRTGQHLRPSARANGWFPTLDAEQAGPVPGLQAALLDDLACLDMRGSW
jgi:hypothetical protein